ncbi:MAG: transporter substrate-binding domain-containing protein [Candidatus Thiodiazotropha sp. (ex Codakia rugifera)]|nr:transporter substrate-binding domain-containing protein [Candidatus Thiodiazotropha sp. (ex Codakia rugifera)]
MKLILYIRRTHLLALILILFSTWVSARDLDEIRTSGVLRHLGIPYANFITGSGDGLDVELIQAFALHLGVRYEYLPTTWNSVFGDLNGQHAKRSSDGHAELLETSPIRGDLVANGMTILDWRRELVNFSIPTFPSGVWLIARADSHLQPIRPTGNLQKDIDLVRGHMQNHSVLALESTCLDPALYRISETGAEVRMLGKGRRLIEMAPAILNGMAETTLLDIPDSLIAMEKWPGEIKVIGPVSGLQEMGVAFRKDSPNLQAAFNAWFEQIKTDGTYTNLVKKYFPTVFLYFQDFFSP